MTRSILRIFLTTLALVVLFAGSFNLNRTSAQEEFEVVAGSWCNDYCNCPGGPCLCCSIIFPDGTQINCGMPC
jgi:hypothetical protein